MLRPSFQMTLSLHIVCFYTNCPKPSKTCLSSRSWNRSTFWINNTFLKYYFLSHKTSRGYICRTYKSRHADRSICLRIYNFFKISYTQTSNMFGDAVSDRARWCKGADHYKISRNFAWHFYVKHFRTTNDVSIKLYLFGTHYLQLIWVRRYDQELGARSYRRRK